MTLATDVFGTQGGTEVPEVWILHGILGSRRNWRAFARSLASTTPGLRWVTVDLRGHGDSPAGQGPHTLQACVDDLVSLARERGQAPMGIVGHSFGGKVALATAWHGMPHLDVVWDLDASPTVHSLPDLAEGEIGRVLDAVRRHPEAFATLDEVVAYFLEAGLPRGIGRWMTTNVVRHDEGLRWRFDLQVITSLMQDYAQTDLWPAVEAPTTAVRLVRAGRGERWSARDLERLEEAADGDVVQAHVIEDSGHWIHVDAPKALARLLVKDLAPRGPTPS